MPYVRGIESLAQGVRVFTIGFARRRRRSHIVPEAAEGVRDEHKLGEHEGEAQDAQVGVEELLEVVEQLQRDSAPLKPPCARRAEGIPGDLYGRSPR
jgi:hypothetical protein